MLVEQSLWSPFPSTGLPDSQQEDGMAIVLTQSPPDYTLLDPAPLSVHEKLKPPPISSPGISHRVGEMLPSSNVQAKVDVATGGTHLHSILHETISAKSLVAVQVSVANENAGEQTKNFGSSLFEVFDVDDSASEYSEGSTSNHSGIKPASDVKPVESAQSGAEQAPVASHASVSAMDTFIGVQGRRAFRSFSDVSSGRNDRKASDVLGQRIDPKLSPPIPPRSTLRNKQVTIIEPPESGTNDGQDQEHRSVFEPAHSTTSIHSPESRPAPQPTSLPEKASATYSPRLSWADPSFPSTSEPLRRAGRSASTSNLPNLSTIPSVRNKLRKAPPRAEVPSAQSPDSGSRLLRAFRIRSPSSLFYPFRGSASTADKKDEPDNLDVEEKDLELPESRPRFSLQHDSSTSGSFLTLSQRSSVIPSATSPSTAITTPDVCSPALEVVAPFIAHDPPPPNMYAAYSMSLPSVATPGLSGLPALRRSKRKPAPSFMDSDANITHVQTPSTADIHAQSATLGAQRQSGVRGGSNKRFWRSSTSINTHRPTLSLGENIEDFLPPVRPEAPFGLDIPNELKTQPTHVPLPAQAVLPEGRKSSSAALAQLAWTGLSSTELASLISRLNMQAYSPERAALVAEHNIKWKKDSGEIFVDSLLTGDPSLLAPMRGKQVAGQLKPLPNREAQKHPNATSAPGMSPVSTLPRRRSTTRQGAVDPTIAMRRWTLAMTDVSDEVLVQELDRLMKHGSSRTRGRPSRKITKNAKRRSGNLSRSGTKNNTDSGCSFVYGGPPESHDSHPNSGVCEPTFRVGDCEEDSASESDEEVVSEDEEVGPDNEEDEEEWKTARKALFCCRELVRTEKNYQSRLRQLLFAEMSPAMYSLMEPNLRALLTASEALSVRLVDDPSAWGVSAAFIACEEELEAAFVAWCGIVGNFFIDGEEKDRKLVRKLTKKAQDDETSVGHGEGEMRSRTQSVRSRKSSGHAPAVKPDRSSPPRPNPPSPSDNNGMFTAALGTGLALGLSPVDPNHNFGRVQSSVNVGRPQNGALSRTLSSWKRKSMPTSLASLPIIDVPPVPPVSPTSTSGHTSIVAQAKVNGADRKPSLRELAIQPTQRVMRYVLQYRDLLEHTPTNSPSRGLVERAHESALRIAQKCDRAQGHSAFLRQS